jgi:hypothetical protein
MSSSGNRSTFVNTLLSAVNTYNLDGTLSSRSPSRSTGDQISLGLGVDIDWEYPNAAGAGQPYSADDSANLLLFFQSLRNKLGSSKIISAAVTQLPWLGSNGKPLTDVSAYAKEMNYVNIMYAHSSATTARSDLFASGTTTSTMLRLILVRTLHSATPVVPTLNRLPQPTLPLNNGRRLDSLQRSFCLASRYMDTFPRVQKQH